MKQAFWRFIYWRLCSVRNWLSTAITYARAQSGYKLGGRGARPEPTLPVQPQ